MRRLYFTLFIVLTLVWGSSFFFTKLALGSFNPILLVQLRTFLGAITLFIVVKFAKKQVNLNVKTLILTSILGAISITIPFVLVTFAQLHLPSSTTSVLTSTTPLFVFIFATLIVRTEKHSFRKLIAIVISFAGALIIGLEKDSSVPYSWWVACVLIAAALYAVANIFTFKFLYFLSPVVLAYLQVSFAAIWMVPLTTITGNWFVGDLTVVSVISLIELGVLASGMNYIIFSKLIQNWGSTMTSLNTYLQPIVGILLGVIILNENISTKGWVAIGMLFSGVLMFGLSRTVLQSLRAKALKGSFGGSGNT